eukprot:CAMPEP_0119376334 /NCGR_PEP_ID=MMETSP1334-20130426/40018_1 /TAXON_ID=127549 /ORGANISM="Calcidiscus leptoporus, Strain RCC1130" /LENGTH=235 /DNA_ID=CAMNT_0007394887 /DNA_START=160 /DNA_END=863 /DNA_ORIENTATION=+
MHFDEARGFSLAGQSLAQRNPENKLFIGGAPAGTDENTLKKIFAEYGEVEEVFVMRGGSRSGQACAFVRFTTAEGALAAIQAIHGKLVMPGCTDPLVVRYADAPGSRAKKGGPRGGNAAPTAISSSYPFGPGAPLGAPLPALSGFATGGWAGSPYAGLHPSAHNLMAFNLAAGGMAASQMGLAGGNLAAGLPPSIAGGLVGLPGALPGMASACIGANAALTTGGLGANLMGVGGV